MSNARASFRNIDLNIDLSDYEDDTVPAPFQPSAPVMAMAAAPAEPSVSQVKEVKTKDFLC